MWLWLIAVAVVLVLPSAPTYRPHIPCFFIAREGRDGGREGGRRAGIGREEGGRFEVWGGGAGLKAGLDNMRHLFFSM